MRIEEIFKYWRRRPFQPFRFHLSDGGSYNVTSPEFMFADRFNVFVGQYPDDSGIPEESALLSPDHITRIEPLDSTPPAELQNKT